MNWKPIRVAGWSAFVMVFIGVATVGAGAILFFNMILDWISGAGY